MIIETERVPGTYTMPEGEQRLPVAGELVWLRDPDGFNPWFGLIVVTGVQPSGDDSAWIDFGEVVGGGKVSFPGEREVRRGSHWKGWHSATAAGYRTHVYASQVRCVGPVERFVTPPAALAV